MTHPAVWFCLSESIAGHELPVELAVGGGDGWDGAAVARVGGLGLGGTGDGEVHAGGAFLVAKACGDVVFDDGGEEGVKVAGGDGVGGAVDAGA